MVIENFQCDDSVWMFVGSTERPRARATFQVFYLELLDGAALVVVGERAQQHIRRRHVFGFAEDGEFSRNCGFLFFKRHQFLGDVLQADRGDHHRSSELNADIAAVPIHSPAPAWPRVWVDDIPWRGGGVPQRQSKYGIDQPAFVVECLAAAQD